MALKKNPSMFKKEQLKKISEYFSSLSTLFNILTTQGFKNLKHVPIKFVPNNDFGDGEIIFDDYVSFTQFLSLGKVLSGALKQKKYDSIVKTARKMQPWITAFYVQRDWITQKKIQDGIKSDVHFDPKYSIQIEFKSGGKLKFKSLDNLSVFLIDLYKLAETAY